jgi:uncharacterized protein (TIGR02271 family)
MSQGMTPRETRAMGAALDRSTKDMAGAAERSAGRMGRATARTTAAFGEVAERSMSSALDSALSTSMAWWDLMMRMQRASLASVSVYSPRSDTRISASQPQRAEEATVLPVGEERLNVATRTVMGETTRIRRRVVAAPVEQQVTLRDEHVVVERRPASAADAQRGEVLTETIIEMSESRQVPEVWKSVHVAEEVVLRREVTERTERVRETLHRDVIEVEHDAALQRPAEYRVGREIAAQAEEAEPRPQAEAPRPAEPRREAEAATGEGNDDRRRRDGGKDQPQPGPGGRKG